MALEYKKAKGMSIRDIAPLPLGGLAKEGWEPINWERRNACERNLKLFAESYLPNVFYLGWSEDQLKCIRKVENVFLEGGMFALAMPRSGGKTAICRAGMIWGTAYGHKRFPYFVGSTQPKAIQTLEFVKLYWYRSKNLRQDFPEIGWSIWKLENRFHLARGQLYRGQPTLVEWGGEAVRYPCLLLPKEDVAGYPESFLIWSEEYQAYYTKNAGVMIATAGIDGSIRGEAEVHPITLEQPRPDVVLLDDVQKDQKAESPAACEKMERLIDGAIQGLAGPGNHIAALMPCTVIADGDVADTYLDRMKKPEWKGERCQLVTSWPPGITDFEIGMDTEPGKAWNHYAELRKQSLRLYEDLRLATEYYLANRAVMDEGFVVSWVDRFDPKTEISAQQHAMNLRLKSPITFPAEYQNRGKKLAKDGPLLVSPGQVAEKTIAIERSHLPVGTQFLTAFLDVQDEILFYTVFGCEPDFTGVFCEYGTWPEVGTRYFTKNQAQGWGLLSREFWKAYPQHRDKGYITEGGKIKPPLEAKIYHALTQASRWLLSREFTRMDEHQTPMTIQALGVDTRWGQASDAIKRFCREVGRREVIPYHGQAIPPTNKQLEEYTRTKGWLFEDQINPQTKEVRWVLRPDPTGQYQLMADVDRMKDFLMARLASPPGSSGSISLYQASPEAHEMFSQHLAGSEYPEPVTARGLTKNKWRERDGRPDNDWLDCAVGCLVLASRLGASLRANPEGKTVRNMTDRTPRRLSEIYNAKRNGG